MFRNIFVMLTNLVFLWIGGLAMYYSMRAVTTPSDRELLDILNRNRHISPSNSEANDALMYNASSAFWLVVYVLSCCIAFVSFLGVLSAVFPWNSLRIHYFRAARGLAVCLCACAAMFYGAALYDSGGKLLARTLLTCCSSQYRNTFLEFGIDNIQRKYNCCGITHRSDYVTYYIPLSCAKHVRGCYFTIADKYLSPSKASLKNYMFLCSMVSCALLIPAVTISCAYGLIDRTACVQLPAAPRCRRRCAQVCGEDRCPTGVCAYPPSKPSAV